MQRKPTGKIMSTHALSLSLAGRNAEEAVVTTIEACVIAGWTGRDAVALEKHVVELEALGVKRPASTPIFYRATKQRLLITDRIETVGHASSGEVEYVVLQCRGQLWVGVGSDHTDREVETYGVTVSKQMCDKPIAPVFWAFEDVADHWDKLILRSFITTGGNRQLYQEGTLDKMLAPKDLISRYTGGGNLAEERSCSVGRSVPSVEYGRLRVSISSSSMTSSGGKSAMAMIFCLCRSQVEDGR
jgi:hypothetical protein